MIEDVSEHVTVYDAYDQILWGTKEVIIDEDKLKEYFSSADDVYFGDASVEREVKEIEKGDLIIDSFAATEYSENPNHMINFFKNMKKLLNLNGDFYILSNNQYFVANNFGILFPFKREDAFRGQFDVVSNVWIRKAKGTFFAAAAVRKTK
ncbi:MAG: hypothetical protein AAF335_04190 [Bacteroidota bacterium]